MKLTITISMFLIALSSGLVGCGAVTSDQLLSIDMYGVSKSPASATGDQDPKFQKYQLLSVAWLSQDGLTTTTLFDNEEESIFRIVDRSQIIFSKKISEEVGNSFGSIQLTFAGTVEGGVVVDEASTFTLSNPKLELVQAFEVEKAKNLNLTIKVNWGNTYSEAGMTEPEYQLSFE